MKGIIALGVAVFAQLGPGPGPGPGERIYRSTIEIKLGEPTVTSAEGKVDKTIVKRYLRRDLNKYRYCYEKQLAIDPSTIRGGALLVKLTVLPDGSVTSVRVEGIHDEVENCVAGFVRRLQLPKVPETAEVRTKVTFKQVKPRPLPPGLGGRCLGLGCGRLD